jgi:hypothetical protein
VSKSVVSLTKAEPLRTKWNERFFLQLWDRILSVSEIEKDEYPQSYLQLVVFTSYYLNGKAAQLFGTAQPIGGKAAWDVYKSRVMNPDAAPWVKITELMGWQIGSTRDSDESWQRAAMGQLDKGLEWMEDFCTTAVSKRHEFRWLKSPCCEASFFLEFQPETDTEVLWLCSSCHKDCDAPANVVVNSVLGLN